MALREAVGGYFKGPGHLISTCLQSSGRGITEDLPFLAVPYGKHGGFALTAIGQRRGSPVGFVTPVRRAGNYPGF